MLRRRNYKKKIYSLRNYTLNNKAQKKNKREDEENLPSSMVVVELKGSLEIFLQKCAALFCS